MNIFKFVFESRGPVNLAKRTGQVFSRFGPGAGRMGRRFDRFMDLLDEHGCRPTFPMTALPLSRNPQFARRLIDRGAELAVHAYTHTDLTTLSKAKQMDHLGKAIRVFRKFSVPFSGFRAPYLHWNEDTMAAVEAYEFRYSSNEVVLWDVVELESLKPSQRIGWQKAKAFYRPRDAGETFVLPFRRRGFVEIPVSLPDDEILLDRMYIDSADVLGEAWQAMVERTYERGELFTLQLHPERIDFFTDVLGQVLASCRQRQPGVWIATLDEISEWWREKAENSVEFVKENNRYRVRVKACRGATVYFREQGHERTIDPGDITLEGGVRPCVGVGPGSARTALQLLRDKGYVVEIGTEKEDFAIHTGTLDGGGTSLGDVVGRLEQFEGPLIRFGVWPHGNRSALAVTGDIDALTIWDFLHRFRGA